MKWGEGILAESLFITFYFKMEVTDYKEESTTSGFQGISSMQEILYWGGNKLRLFSF